MSVEIEVIRVFILAENRLLRGALALLLGKKSGLRVVDARAFSAQLVRQVAEACPDILLSDSSTIALPALQVIAEIRAAVPGVKVITIGMEEDRNTFLQAVREGVSGYVLKDASANELAAAVRAVADGQAVCPPNLCMALFEFVAEERLQPSSFRLGHELGLTRREQQLVQMIDRGLTNKEIAAQLNLSEQTVKNHVHHMLRKLGASDRLAAAELCRPPRVVA
jgi:DNA-binding NarL/FixJ family response regulator